MFAEAFGYGIGISGQRSSLRRRWLPVRQAAGGDVGINALIGADLGVLLAPVARIQRHHLGPCTGCCCDALQHGFEVLDI